jgi:hypothetical protein
MRSPEEKLAEHATAGSEEWGRDPSVRLVRRVFAAMEAGQKDLLRTLALSPFDPRLRRWRERALAAFEAPWARGARGDAELSETEAGALYVLCLGKIMAGEGIKGVPGSQPENEELRLRLFGRCRIYHDPVAPVLKAPADIGWEAWFRRIDLVTPRRLNGKELLMRTRGWWTVEPAEVAPVVEAHGRLVVGEKGELLVEFADHDAAVALSKALSERFGDQVLLAP